MRRWLIPLIILTLLAAFLTSGCSVRRTDEQSSKKVSNLAKAQKELPVIGSYAKFKDLMAKAQQTGSGYYGMGRRTGIASAKSMAVLQDAAAPTAEYNKEDSGGTGYSKTNVQVEGVDEADVVKTDGRYIYQVNDRKVVIADAYPGENLKVLTTLKYADNFNTRELYVDDKYLVVIGEEFSEIKSTEPKAQNSTNPKVVDDKSRVMVDTILPARMRATVKTIIYDLSDKAHPNKVRETEIEGNYISSRKIGPALYLVANKYLDYYYIMAAQSGAAGTAPESTVSPTPSYRDSAVKSGAFTEIGYDDIRYFPQSVEPNYLMVTGLNLDEPSKPLKVSTYLGAGENIYVSQENLYVAVTQFEQVKPEKSPAKPKEAAPKKTGSSQNAPVQAAGSKVAPDQSSTSQAAPDQSASKVAPSTGGASILPAPDVMPEPPKTDTILYKFALDNGNVDYQGKGQVPGTILNQFSMDESNGYFRIATTVGDAWRNDQYTSRNNLYVLDNSLKITGKLEGLAPGEKIYSVRFMGDKAYLVTFKTVDPLFVIDLQNPQSPKVLGALKIPGYSDYLHPYDENHIIGFGKETVEIPKADWQGKKINTAFYQGMKIALFDVSDVNHPKELFKTVIGDRGTDSELLRNHKALLFDKSRNLIAFPVELAQIKRGPTYPGEIPYGEMVYQGAYIYNLDLKNGFTYRGRISHLTGFSPLDFDYFKFVQRILYIDNTLYTLSLDKIKAVDISTLKEINSVSIPK